MTDLDAMFHRTQERLDRLRRNRREVASETPAERARRQSHRADHIVADLTGGRHVNASLRRAILALVVADEAPDPPGDLPEPKSPGARAVLKPTKKKSTKNTNQEELF